MSIHEDNFDIVQIEPSDWIGMSPSEAYACGIEMGCFIQAITISKKNNETLRLKLPSERAERAKKYLEAAGEDGAFYWINDDIMLVVVERDEEE